MPWATIKSDTCNYRGQLWYKERKRANMLAGLANGEFDHDSCEATASTKGANYDIMNTDEIYKEHRQNLQGRKV